MADRGPASYVAEFVGTLVLVFFITTVLTLFVAHGQQAAQFGSDFAVVGLAHGFVLLLLLAVFARTSGGHFNPAVTLAAFLLRRIKGIDALIYGLVQLSGGVAGALLTQAMLRDEGRAADYGAATVNPAFLSALQGMIVELVGVFLLVLVYCAVLFNARARPEWGPLSIGAGYAAIVMVIGPLTDGAVNPARWFGPGLVGSEFGDVWPYLVSAILGSLAAAGLFRFVIEPGEAVVAEAEGGAVGKTP